MGWIVFHSMCLFLFVFPSWASSLVPLCNHADSSALLEFKNSVGNSTYIFFIVVLHTILLLIQRQNHGKTVRIVARGMEWAVTQIQATWLASTLLASHFKVNFILIALSSIFIIFKNSTLLSMIFLCLKYLQDSVIL